VGNFPAPGGGTKRGPGPPPREKGPIHPGNWTFLKKMDGPGKIFRPPGLSPTGRKSIGGGNGNGGQTKKN